MSNVVQNQIYKGVRGERFQNMIKSLLKRGNLNDKHIGMFTNKKSMLVYDQAFTAESAVPKRNYEMFEQLGDVTANKFIVWYMYRRFPQLRETTGVKVVARLRINYGARQSFSEIGERLGFWEFISASEEDRGRKKKDLLEDCVESFVGATELIMDDEFRPGIGQAVVYDILSNVFDDIPISLRYEDLYDAKTRLKEIFDFHKDTIGKLKYTNTRDEDTGLFKASAIRVGITGKDRTIGYGSATKLKDAEQRAAENGLITTVQDGFTKPIPPEYALFNKGV
jgi:dsRNA-specific ribonuclease